LQRAHYATLSTPANIELGGVCLVGSLPCLAIHELSATTTTPNSVKVKMSASSMMGSAFTSEAWLKPKYTNQVL
jgi:hypothetical protein